MCKREMRKKKKWKKNMNVNTIKVSKREKLNDYWKPENKRDNWKTWKKGKKERETEIIKEIINEK